jgi:hypothetical protein
MFAERYVAERLRAGRPRPDLRAAEVVEPIERVSIIADDPADGRVLEAAQTAEAAVIVSGEPSPAEPWPLGRVAILGPE